MEYKKTSEPAIAMTSACGCAGGCCAVYEKPWVQDFLGESFHPGGIELSMRSIESLALPRGARILDVACGTGVSARALADFGYDVVGIDASQQQVEGAIAKSEGREKLAFLQASAESPPNDLSPFDGIFCECAFSLVSDQAHVAQSWIRSLWSGGRLAISDMVVNQELPQSLKGSMGDWACLGGARSANNYQAILEQAGFVDIRYTDERQAMLQSISQLKRKLLLYGVSHLADFAQDLGASLCDLKNALKDATIAVQTGALTYGRFSATRP